MTNPAGTMLKPTTPGLIVRDPKTGAALPAEGALVDLNTYWLRRLRDGSVAKVKAAPKATQKT